MSVMSVTQLPVGKVAELIEIARLRRCDISEAWGKAEELGRLLRISTEEGISCLLNFEKYKAEKGLPPP